MCLRGHQLGPLFGQGLRAPVQTVLFSRKKVMLPARVTLLCKPLKRTHTGESHLWPLNFQQNFN